MTSPRRLFQFPNPVNETSARLVALGVVTMAVAFLATGWTWIVAVMAYGFVARVTAGPTFSPLGRLVTEVITPRLNVSHRYTAGPPKRFAQGIGAVFTVTALACALAGSTGGAKVVIGMLTVAASLEAFAGICLGCIGFGWLMRRGVIPDDVCADCADISRRLAEVR